MGKGMNPNSLKNLRPCKPGEIRNPNGKDKGTKDRLNHFIDVFIDALDSDKEKNGDHLIEHAIKRARTDNTLLAALLKKIIPDKLSAEIQGQLIQQIIDYKNADHTNPSS